MSHGDLRLLFPLRIRLSPNFTGLHLHTRRLLPVFLSGCCCRVSLVSVGAGTLPPLPTGGRGASHLGDVDRALSVCCDADPGAEKSFTISESDAEFLGVVLIWAHVIDDAYGPDALDEYMISWDDGSSGYSHHSVASICFLSIWLLVGVLLGACLMTALCATGLSTPFYLMRGSLLSVVHEPQNGAVTT